MIRTALVIGSLTLAGFAFVPNASAVCVTTDLVCVLDPDENCTLSNVGQVGVICIIGRHEDQVFCIASLSGGYNGYICWIPGPPGGCTIAVGVTSGTMVPLICD
jgi:hypothetical protein